MISCSLSIRPVAAIWVRDDAGSIGGDKGPGRCPACGKISEPVTRKIGGYGTGVDFGIVFGPDLLDDCCDASCCEADTGSIPGDTENRLDIFFLTEVKKASGPSRTRFRGFSSACSGAFVPDMVL